MCAQASRHHRQLPPTSTAVSPTPQPVSPPENEPADRTHLLHLGNDLITPVWVVADSRTAGWPVPGVMSLKKLSAGDGYTYLTRQVAAGDTAVSGRTGLAAYYAQRGEAPGRWIGAGLADLGTAGQVTEQQMKNLFGLGIHPDADKIIDAAAAAGTSVPAAASTTRLGSPYSTFAAAPLNAAWRKALAIAFTDANRAAGLPADWPVPEADRRAIRTTVGTEMFHQTYRRPPTSAHELTAFITRASRPAPTAVAGFDVTFSPVKSVSTLWAIAPTAVSQVIADAHNAAVKTAFDYLEDSVAYTRLGRGGAAQVEATGLIGAAFAHRDSRAGDPDLHTHVALANKVRTLDGRWRALDGRMLYRHAVAASERYNTALEGELATRLGLTFTPRQTEPGKRPIREITGVSTVLTAAWSTRRDSIVAARKELVDVFRTEHSRLPTATEMIRLSQQATLATRDAKKEPRTLAEQRQAWRAQATDLLGDDGIQAMLNAVRAGTPRYAAIDPDMIGRLADATIDAVSGSRARWRTANLTAEALRQTRTAGVAETQVDDVVSRIVHAATAPGRTVKLGVESEVDAPRPPELCRSNGASVFTVEGSQQYTSPQILAAETRLTQAAGTGGAATISRSDVELAILEWSANNGGKTLNTSQRQLVHQVAASDRKVMLALAPAGTGKTTTMGVLATAWQAAGGTVIGLAPQASAAQVLAEAIGARADTVAKLVYDTCGTGPGARPGDWDAIDGKTLVVIDEAALSGTIALDAAVAFVTGRGGRVLLVGDDRQRAASGAGGVLRDIEAAHGAVHLDEVLRFTDPTEGAASLALRAGDAGAVGFYNDRGRIKEVTEDTAAGAVHAAWRADVAAGAESIMIAPTLDLVRRLNALARTDRREAGLVTGPELGLPSGEQVAAGDVIVTKHNARTLTLGGTDFVRNNQRWTVTAIDGDGSLTATEHDRGVTRTLPAWYVAAGNVRLGYAATAASVQGTTVGSAHRRRGTAHAIVTETMTRNDLYPVMTRGTDANTAYVVVAGTGDAHDILSPDVVLTPPTAVETIKAVIARDGTPVSATTENRIAQSAQTRLGPAADAYVTAIGIGAQTLVGQHDLDAITGAVAAAIPGIIDAPAWDTLRDHIATLSLDASPEKVAETVVAAANSRELDSARDIAAVIDWRLDPTGRHSQKPGPLPYLLAIPARLAADDRWQPYLAARAGQVSDLAAQVRDTAATWTAQDAPTWALPYLADTALTCDLAVWRAAHQVPDVDMRPAGPRPHRIAEAHSHTRLTARAQAVVGSPGNLADAWALTIRVFGNVDITHDDYWPAVAQKLTTAQDAGIDVNPLLISAVSAPLPAEATAAALWWRLARHLGDASGARRGTVDTAVPWRARISETLGETLTAHITADPLWPVICARFDRAARDGADPDQLAGDAAALVSAHTTGMATAEAAPRLLASLSALTDPEPLDHDLDPEPPEPGTEPLTAEELATAKPAAAGRPSRSTSPTGHPATADNVDPSVAVAPLPGETIPLPDAPPDHEPDPALDSPAEAPATDRAAMVAATADTWDYYRRQAPTSWVPRYLQDRGIDPTCAGYAPAGWTHLVDHLRNAGYSNTTIAAAGLARTSSRGSLIDAFRDRAVLPIRDTDGTVVGFTGRANPNAKPHGDYMPPKYINTATTDLFHKNQIPYGLTFDAVVALRAGADLIIVEGPFDAQAVSQAVPRDDMGLPTLVAIAPLGTALTTGQLETLSHIAPLADRTVTLALDNDPAGRAAAAKAWTILAAAGITDPHTIIWPGKDPADLVAQHGPDALRNTLADTSPLADRLIADIIDNRVSSNRYVEERVAALRQTAPIIAALPEPHRMEAAGDLAERLDLDVISVIDEIAKHRTDTPKLSGPLDLPTPPALSSYSRNIAALPDVQRTAESPATSGLHDPREEGQIGPARDRGPGLGW